MSPSPLEAWVEESADLTQPAQIHWCDGSDAEYEAIVAKMLSDASLIRLNENAYPGCVLHRSHPNDVARTEHLTFVCTTSRGDAGPNNNWMSPGEGKDRARSIFRGAMRGRTMYVLPYIMGPGDSPYSKVGVELTDSPYVAISMRIMTRMGTAALSRLGGSADFAPGLHSVADLNPDRRLVLHFPEERLVWSVGSGYGGNALLGKKCLSLRLASWMAREEGWLAEHMLILGLEDPTGSVTYMAAAFPSACGKTNLAMLVSPLAAQGYRVWTVGDDIAWMRVGPDGRLWATNPENGFFGVVPGTNEKTNPNMLRAAGRNSIYTNVGLTPGMEPWWEGLGAPPAGLIDWQNHPYDAASGRPAAHANSRFTVPTRQCPSISPQWEDPNGVPISAIIFGGRRARTAPLVFESTSWQHGVYMGATIASETTAAATGQVGVVRRDPMAMLPFCGYHMGDYFAHWLSMAERLTAPPRIFQVNWFRRDEENRFIWPGFGENVRVLKWILERVQGRGQAKESPIGLLPTDDAIDLGDLPLGPAEMHQLLSVDRSLWSTEAAQHAEFLSTLGDRVPAGIWDEQRALAARLAS